MSVMLVQNVLNQVVVSSSSSAAEALVEEPSSLDVPLELGSELELLEAKPALLEAELELELGLLEADAAVAAGAAVPLPELQPATSSPLAASTLIQDERFNCHSLSVPAPHRPGALCRHPPSPPHGDGRKKLRPLVPSCCGQG